MERTECSSKRKLKIKEKQDVDESVKDDENAMSLSKKLNEFEAEEVNEFFADEDEDNVAKATINNEEVNATEGIPKITPMPIKHQISAKEISCELSDQLVFYNQNFSKRSRDSDEESENAMEEAKSLSNSSKNAKGQKSKDSSISLKKTWKIEESEFASQDSESDDTGDKAIIKDILNYDESVVSEVSRSIFKLAKHGAIGKSSRLDTPCKSSIVLAEMNAKLAVEKSAGPSTTDDSDSTKARQSLRNEKKAEIKSKKKKLDDKDKPTRESFDSSSSNGSDLDFDFSVAEKKSRAKKYFGEKWAKKEPLLGADLKKLPNKKDEFASEEKHLQNLAKSALRSSSDDEVNEVDKLKSTIKKHQSPKKEQENINEAKLIRDCSSELDEGEVNANNVDFKTIDSTYEIEDKFFKLANELISKKSGRVVGMI